MASTLPSSLKGIHLHQGPYRTDLIDDLSNRFLGVNMHSSYRFTYGDLNRRLQIVTDAMNACNEFCNTYFSATPICYKPSYINNPRLQEPEESKKDDLFNIDALNLELPILTFSEKRDIKALRAPRTDLEAKALGLKVAEFAEKYKRCLRNHYLPYIGLKQFTDGLNLPEDFELQLPRNTDLFNRRILHGDDRYNIFDPFAKGSTAVVRKINLDNAHFALKEFNNYDQFLQEVGACLVLPPCDEIISVEATIPCGLIVEYAQEKTLQELRDSNIILPQETIKKYLLTLATALEIIHSRGFVHTDVKPNNVFRFEGDKIKLADLGNLKRINSKQVWESSRFATPPEKFLEKNIEPSGDIWALGALAFSLLTKKRSPFTENELTHLENYIKIMYEKNYMQDVSVETLKACLNEEHLSYLKQQDPNEFILSLVAQCMSGHIDHRPTAKELKERLLQQIQP